MKKILYILLLLYPTIAKGASQIRIPVDGFISSGFGYRTSPITHKPAFHEGYDIVAPVGTPVYAPISGKIFAIGYDSGFGTYIMLENKQKKLMALFGHLDIVLVGEGEYVKRGDFIGTVGMTGRTTGPHLHYEVRFRGKLVNPHRYCKIKEVNKNQLNKL